MSNKNELSEKELVAGRELMAARADTAEVESTELNEDRSGKGDLEEAHARDYKKLKRSVSRIWASGVIATTNGIDRASMNWMSTAYLNATYAMINDSPNEYALVKAAPATMGDVGLQFKPILAPYVHVVGKGRDADWYVWDGTVHKLQEDHTAATAINELVTVAASEAGGMVINRAAEMQRARQPYDEEELQKMSEHDLGDILEKMGYQGWKKKAHAGRMKMILDSNQALTGIESEDYGEIMRALRRNLKDLRDRKLPQMEAQLERTLQTSPEVFEEGDRYLVADNGVIDLDEVFSTGKIELKEHSPERMVTERNRLGTAMPESIDLDDIDLSDLSANGFAPNLELYLRSTDERASAEKDSPRGDSYRDDLLGLLTAVGVGVTTDVVLRVLPFLYGASAGGKGLLFRLLEQVFPGHYETGGRAVFTHGKESNRFSAGEVIDHRLLISDEMAEVTLDQDAYKDWSGDAKIRVQNKNAKDRSVHYKGVILTALNTSTDYNHLPNLADPGMYSRYMAVYFPYSFSQSANPKAYREPDNENLEEDICSGEQAQFVAVLLRLTRDWLRSEYVSKKMIPLTEHQKVLRDKSASGGDHIEAVMMVGKERKLWQEAQEGTPKKELVTFSEVYRNFKPIYEELYLEKPKHKVILEEMRAKGMIDKNGNSNVIVGYVDGGSWAKRVGSGDLTQGM